VWTPVWEAVHAFAAAPARRPEIVEREFEIAGRQIRVQLASLGPSPDGLRRRAGRRDGAGAGGARARLGGDGAAGGTHEIRTR